MASTEIEFQPANQRKKGLAGTIENTRTFIWNSEKGEFMGRTGSSWGKIGIFYFIFYSCLAAFFAGMLAVFFQTMGDAHPAQIGMNSLLKDNPGMGFRPMPKVDSTLIKFKQGVPSSYEKYTSNIKSYLDKYKVEPEGSDLVDCDPYPSNVKPEEGKACRVRIDELGDKCTEEKHFGYKDGTPCVLLKLNKVYNWEPERFANGSEPEELLGENYNGDGVYVTCEGETTSDKDNLNKVDFYPAQGFLNKYFPFSSQKGYQQPVVFARLKNLESGIITQVWCKAWSKGMKHHKNDRAGSVHFEVLMD